MKCLPTYLLTFRLVVKNLNLDYFLVCHFRVPKTLIFKTRQCLLVKVSLICMIINNYFHINYTSERIYATRGFQNPLFVISEQYILFIHLFIFTTTLQVIETSIVGPVCTVCKRIYFFFILVPRLSGKEQLLFSFVKMAEPESIGGGTDTDHHDNKLVKVGFHTMLLCIYS